MVDRRVQVGLLCIGLLAFAFRGLSLDAFLSPDEPRWEQNTIGFKEALETGDPSGLYQQPHPGIATMWASFATIEAESWGAKRMPLALLTSVLVVLASYLIVRIWGPVPGILAGVLLSVHPILVAHSRVLAMDALLSLFLLIGVIALIGWLNTDKRAYMALSGSASALAVLSKMAGAVIIPFVGVVLLGAVWWKLRSSREVLRAAGVWAASFAVTAVIVFPTILTDFPLVWEGTKQFFATEHYQQAVHALGPRWYPQALLIWSTPLELAAILALIVWPAFPKKARRDLLLLGAFTLLFLLAMQYSIKKGDRYILPVFVSAEVLAAGILAIVWTQRQKLAAKIVLGVAAVAFVWQASNLVSLHPHALAYRNPMFRSVALGRTMGWGEGLDLAAAYLNQMPDAANTLVIAYYEGPFALHYDGMVTSAERLARETVEEIGGDYVVLYRTMQGRAPERWETHVLQQFADKTPIHTIWLNGEEYAWIYKAE